MECQLTLGERLAAMQFFQIMGAVPMADLEKYLAFLKAIQEESLEPYAGREAVRLTHPGALDKTLACEIPPALGAWMARMIVEYYSHNPVSIQYGSWYPRNLNGLLNKMVGVGREVLDV